MLLAILRLFVIRTKRRMYPYHQGDNPSAYQFVTNSGITYVVEFSDASAYFDEECDICNSIEAVAFSPIGRKGNNDIEIKETICDIIRHRCINNGVAIVFVCDQSGGASRDKIFKGWDSLFNGGRFHFQPAEIEHQTGILYTGLIVEISNPNSGHFLGSFRNAMSTIAVKLN